VKSIFYLVVYKLRYWLNRKSRNVTLRQLETYLHRKSK